MLSPEGQAKFKDQRGPTDLTPEGQLRAQALDDLDEGADLTPDQQLDQLLEQRSVASSTNNKASALQTKAVAWLMRGRPLRF